MSPSNPVRHDGSDDESGDDHIRKPAYTFPKAVRAGGGSRAGSETGGDTGAYAGYGSEFATGMSTPNRSDAGKTSPVSRDPLNPFLVPRADAYKKRAHGSGVGASLGAGGDAGLGRNAAAVGEEESMSDILARMKLKTHASDAGGSGGGSVGDRGGRLVGIRGGGGGTSLQYLIALILC